MKLHCCKKLAVAMALAITVTALPTAPVAEAAATPAFKTYRKTLYENGTSGGSYTYTVKNIKKGYTVKWSLSKDGAEFAEWSSLSTKATKTTVSNTVKIDTTGDMKGKNSSLTLVAKVYDTSNKLVNTIKDNVTLKVQATSVAIKTSKIADALTSLSTGGSYDFDRTIKPYNSTSKTYWSVTGSDGLDYSSEINSSGIWTPSKEGTYTITAISRNSKTSKELCRNTVTAVVGTTLNSIKQTAVNKIEATFNCDVSKKVTADNFTIKESSGLATVLPKEVAFSADGKTVTITTHTNFKNNTAYTVSYGNTAKSFTASAGEANRIVILTESVPANTATVIDYALYDANDIDVTAMAKGTVEFSSNLVNGYITEDNKVFLTTVGKGGTITATYTEGTAIKFTATKSITCKEAEATTVTSTDFTITDSSTKPDFTASSYVADTSISIGETGYAHFRALDNHKNVINFTKITYASSDENALIVEANGKMTPIKEGEVVVIASAFEGSVETTYTFKVTVQAAKKLSSLGLSASTITMSNCGDSNYKNYIEVIPFDQFGTKMDVSKCTVTVTETYNRSYASYNAATGKIEVSVPGGTVAGNYAFTVSAICNGVTATQNFYLTVVNVPSSTAIGYALVADGGSNTFDISIKNGESISTKTATLRLARYRGGVFDGYNYFETATITKDGKYYSRDLTAAGTTTKTDIPVGTMELPLTLAKISTSDSGNVIQKAETGTYSIVATLNGKQYTLGLTLTDTQGAPTVSIKSTTSSASKANALELAKDCLELPSGYEIIDCTAVGTTNTGATISITSGSKLHIQTITVKNQITLTDAEGKSVAAAITYTVNVGQTFTNK